MKTITITVDVDGNSVTRTYSDDTLNPSWDDRVNDMLDTLEKSDKPFKEIPGFEGTMDKLNEF